MTMDQDLNFKKILENLRKERPIEKQRIVTPPKVYQGRGGTKNAGPNEYLKGKKINKCYPSLSYFSSVA